MSFGRVGVLVFSCAITGCAITGARQAPPAGPIAADPGGAAGYQHGMERSQFIVGDAPRSANQFGFTKLVGSEGSFAVDMTNGAVIAIPGAHSADMQKDVWYTQGSAKHNDAVRAYFIAAGIPPDQIRGVHALTSLYASGGERDAAAAQPKISGWQSVLERSVGGVPVVDSVAWARMNDQGKVISEWVYWPAIPAKAINDARRLQAMLAQDSSKASFLARLPRDLAAGKVVIRHSSVAESGPFEVFASYDVLERRTSQDASASTASRVPQRTAVYVRHFDVDGNERKLPQERRSPSGNFPSEKPPPPGAGAAK